MSTPMVARLLEKRTFFANFRSNNVVRSPIISLESSRFTVFVVVLPVDPKQPTPFDAVAHGIVARAALSGFQTTSFLLTVNTAWMLAPGSDWNTALTSTSAHGIT